MTTTTKITANQIIDLANEARASGDDAMFRACQRALCGSARAMRIVVRAIRAASAMAD